MNEETKAQGEVSHGVMGEELPQCLGRVRLPTWE